MENNQPDFFTDLNKFSNIINKIITINNVDITLELTEYSNPDICQTITNWGLCFDILGRHDLMKTKEFMMIVYCLLSNCSIINFINGNKMDLDLFDVALERFLRFDVVDKKRRTIRLKIFTVCNSMIVLDMNDDDYKLYEIHNLDMIKEYYNSSKVNFDDLIKDIKIKPIFKGSINGLSQDYKVLSLTNFKKDEEKIITELEKFLVNEIKIEKQIMREYNKFYKMAKSK